MGTTLNQTEQNFIANGLVNEFTLTHEDYWFEPKDGGDREKAYRIRGILSIRMGLNTKKFELFCNSVNSKGGENQLWKNANTWLELIPEINSSITYREMNGQKDKNGRYDYDEVDKVNISGDSENASRVEVTGSVRENSFVTKEGVKTNLRWAAQRVSRSRADEDKDGCTFDGVFYIKSIVPETKDETETGRLKVTLCAVDYNASPIVFDAFVDEDLADDFEDFYEVGATAPLSIESRFEHVGATKKERKWGSQGKNTKEPYDFETLIIVGGDDAIEDPEDDDVDNGWIDPDAMKKALRERAKKFEELKNKGETTSTTNNSRSNMQDRKKAANNTKKKPPVEEDFDDPFDDEEEPF